MRPVTTRNPPLRTHVYIDGYNLYYGRLRGTVYKWLDVVALFESLLRQRDQNESLELVRIFTAHALANFSGHHGASVEAQAAYHRALKARYRERIDLVYGIHSFDRDGTLLPTFVTGQPYDRLQRSRVWKLEEKKTDVNLALAMYRDANKELCERMILVSNDSDVEPALRAIREDFPDIHLGVVATVRPPTPGTTSKRRVSGSLSAAAHWTVSHLTDAQLEAAQLPTTVATRKKPVRKPLHW